MYGQHFSDTFAGRVFSQSVTPLGVAIPIYSTTAVVGGLPIYNPAQSGVVVEIVSVDICYSSGTSTYGCVGFMAGSIGSIGTATGCSVFTATYPAVNGFLFNGNASRVMSANAGTVTVTAGVVTPPVMGVVGAGWYKAIADFNLEAQTATPLGVGKHTYDMMGTILVPPGTIIYLAAMQATTALFATSIIWKEIPIN